MGWGFGMQVSELGLVEGLGFRSFRDKGSGFSVSSLGLGIRGLELCVCSNHFAFSHQHSTPFNPSITQQASLSSLLFGGKTHTQVKHSIRTRS